MGWEELLNSVDIDFYDKTFYDQDVFVLMGEHQTPKNFLKEYEFSEEGEAHVHCIPVPKDAKTVLVNAKMMFNFYNLEENNVTFKFLNDLYVCTKTIVVQTKKNDETCTANVFVKR